jgi:hypothetical protein
MQAVPRQQEGGGEEQRQDWDEVSGQGVLASNQGVTANS